MTSGSEVKSVNQSVHMPVMLPEVLGMLDVQPGRRYIDATCGEGGHSQAILKAAKVGGGVLGIDADFEAMSVAIERLSKFNGAFVGVTDNFCNIRKIALTNHFSPVHGILFDLGLSSRQLDEEDRGFSFKYNQALDMRFSVTQKLTAADIVNHYAQKDLTDIILRWGEEPQAEKVSRAIVQNRPLKTSLELAEIIAKTIRRRGRIHQATRTFQAIRIAVNDELSNLSIALQDAISIIGYGGRLAVISYHSLEDRVVKTFFTEQASKCVCIPKLVECVCSHKPTLKIITRSIITPTLTEVAFNRRSRSAKLRCAERI